jgi:hypothetical protein
MAKSPDLMPLRLPQREWRGQIGSNELTRALHFRGMQVQISTDNGQPRDAMTTGLQP